MAFDPIAVSTARRSRAGRPEPLADYPLGAPLVGEASQKEFIALFGAILRLQNILTSFDDFAGNELFSERQGQDYRSLYLYLWAAFRRVGEAERRSSACSSSGSSVWARIRENDGPPGHVQELQSRPIAG